MSLVSRPCGTPSELTGITTAGVGGAVAFPTEAVTPFIAPTQVKVYVSAKAYVCFGAALSPDATPPVGQCAVQQAATEEVYTLTGIVDAGLDHLWIYAKASTIDSDVSWFG